MCKSLNCSGHWEKTRGFDGKVFWECTGCDRTRNESPYKNEE